MDPDVVGGTGYRLYSELNETIIGQEEAVSAVVSAYRDTQSGLQIRNEGPVASFLFLGPTGSGKTFLAETTAKLLSGGAGNLVIVNCAEFQHSQDISKLIGSPPGYVGHKETTPILNQKTLDRSLNKTCPFSFVLFDEIEKANDALWNLLLGILDKGKMKTGANQDINLTRCLIFMTSNLGAEAMEKFLRPTMGLGPCPSQEDIEEKLGKVGVQAAAKKFTPEFNNRIDYTVTFRPLNRENLRQILDLELNMLQDSVFARRDEKSYMFAVSTAAREKLLDYGTDAKYGARFLKRTMRRYMTSPISNLVCSGQVVGGDMVLVDWDERNKRFDFCKLFEGMSTLEMGWAQNLIYADGVIVPTIRQMRAIQEPKTA